MTNVLPSFSASHHALCKIFLSLTGVSLAPQRAPQAPKQAFNKGGKLRGRRGLTTPFCHSILPISPLQKPETAPTAALNGQDEAENINGPFLHIYTDYVWRFCINIQPFVENIHNRVVLKITTESYCHEHG
mgnify:CR=1 FL=1